MATGTFEYRTDGERRAIERAIAFVAEMHESARAAPAGHVLDQCEARAADGGRDLLRDLLGRAVQERADAAEKKKGPHGGARAAGPCTSSGGATGR